MIDRSGEVRSRRLRLEGQIKATAKPETFNYLLRVFVPDLMGWFAGIHLAYDPDFQFTSLNFPGHDPPVAWEAEPAYGLIPIVLVGCPSVQWRLVSPGDRPPIPILDHEPGRKL